MAMNKQSYRDKIAEMFIQGLDEKGLKFVKEWYCTSGTPISYQTGKAYKGLNAILLSIAANRMGYKDNRWLTFKQIQDHKFHLNKGSKGVQISYFLPYDIENKKAVSWNDFHEDVKDLTQIEIDRKYSLIRKLYTVFNGDMVVGIEPKLEKIPINNIEKVEVVDRVSAALNIPIIEGGDRAFYAPYEDRIQIPPKEHFTSQGAYASTCLHELGHGTGHPARLNRNQTGGFGSENYAKEELIAEITSAFMGEYIDESIDETTMNNHKAYINSWIKSIKDDNSYLFTAIKEAEKASNYMIDKAHLITREEKQELLKDIKKAIIDFEEREYDKTDIDFDKENPDLSRINLAYSTTEYGNHDINFELDLVNYSWRKVVNYEIIEEGEFKGENKHPLEEIKDFVKDCEFSELVDIDPDLLEKAGFSIDDETSVIRKTDCEYEF